MTEADKKNIAFSYFLSRERSYNNRSSHYAEWFREDFCLGVPPYVRDKEKEVVQINIAGEDQNKAIAICLSVSQNKYGYSTNEEKVAEAIRVIGRSLIWSEQGRSLYQLIDEKNAFRLHFFPTYNLLSLPFVYLQYIFKKEDYQYIKTRFHLVLKRQVWRIEMPEALGGRRKYSRLIKKLEKHGSLVPVFCNGASEQAMQDRIAITSSYAPRLESYIFKITKEFGWNLRKTEGISSFYYIYRHLKFKKAQMVLREHIVQELNRLFKHLSLDAKIEITTNVSIQNLSDQINELMNPATDFLKFLQKHGYQIKI